MTKQSRDEALEELRTMFRDVLAASAAEGHHERLSRARGCVDGYMRALLTLGAASRVELLAMVGAERARASGPALRWTEPSSDEITAA